MIKVFLADDDALVRGGIKALLDAEPDITVVGEAADGRRAVELIRTCRPDVVMVDVRMPGYDGVPATWEITAWPSPRPRVLVLTTFDDALTAGADGFLLKRATPEQMIAGIRTVATGETVISAAVARRLVDVLTARATTPEGAAELPAPNARPTCCGHSPAGCPTPRSPLDAPVSGDREDTHQAHPDQAAGPRPNPRRSSGPTARGSSTTRDEPAPPHRARRPLLHERLLRQRILLGRR